MAPTTKVAAASPAAPRRRYRSQLREQQSQQTRRAVVHAARELFVAKGWAATGMREVATAAGVAVETVYAHFSSKRGLLRAVIDTAATGDDAPVPLARRPEFLAMGTGVRAARVDAAARLVTEVHVRTAAVAKLVRSVASADETIGEMLSATRERQRQDVATALELVVQRPPTEAERDGVWAVVSPEVWFLLVEESGWTPEQYEAWIRATLDHLVPRS